MKSLPEYTILMGKSQKYLIPRLPFVASGRLIAHH